MRQVPLWQALTTALCDTLTLYCENAPEFGRLPPKDRVWGDLKSKNQLKTSFLKRTPLDLCNKKDLKNFYQKLLKLSKL